MKKDTIATAELNGGKEVKDLFSLMLVKYQNNSESNALHFDIDDIERILGVKKDDPKFFRCAQKLCKDFGSSYIKVNNEFDERVICSGIKYQQSTGWEMMVNPEASQYLKDIANLQIQ